MTEEPVQPGLLKLLTAMLISDTVPVHFLREADVRMKSIIQGTYWKEHLWKIKGEREGEWEELWFQWKFWLLLNKKGRPDKKNPTP